jgi:hypothetical protein
MTTSTPPRQISAVVVDHTDDGVLAALNKVGAVDASHRIHVYGLESIGLCAVVQAALLRCRGHRVRPEPQTPRVGAKALHRRRLSP